MLRLHDTALGRSEELKAREPGRISLYVCGSTVYGPPHIGHGRFSLVYDILRRYLEWSGVVVDHVSNVTDVDDKIIARANEEGLPAAEIAERYEAEWWGAMDTLGCLPPTRIPHATAFIDQMVDLISELVALGVAYETSDGVYFTVADVADYGLLAHQGLDSCGQEPASRSTRRSGRRSTSRSGRRRSQVSLRGRRPSAPAAPVGTPSASSCRSPSSGRGSTCTAAVRI